MKNKNGSRNNSSSNSKNKKTLYLAYGSNLSIEQMAHRCPRAKVVGVAMLRGWKLCFKVHATVEPVDPSESIDPTYPTKGHNVPVLVWELTPMCELALDLYEGYSPANDGRNGYYRKEYVNIQVHPLGDAFPSNSDAPFAEAMLYIMNPRPLQLPHRHYFDIIHDAYIDLGFDFDVLFMALEEARAAHNTSRLSWYNPITRRK
jgi:hypothetical protein